MTDILTGPINSAAFTGAGTVDTGAYISEPVTVAANSIAVMPGAYVQGLYVVSGNDGASIAARADAYFGAGDAFVDCQSVSFSDDVDFINNAGVFSIRNTTSSSVTINFTAVRQ